MNGLMSSWTTVWINGGMACRLAAENDGLIGKWIDVWLIPCGLFVHFSPRF